VEEAELQWIQVSFLECQYQEKGKENIKNTIKIEMIEMITNYIKMKEGN
jgi:CRISPR/Cas system-associated endoribonuclease Cas2